MNRILFVGDYKKHHAKTSRMIRGEEATPKTRCDSTHRNLINSIVNLFDATSSHITIDMQNWL